MRTYFLSRTALIEPCNRTESEAEALEKTEAALSVGGDDTEI